MQEVTYQPFISLFHMFGLTDSRPDLKGVREYRFTSLHLDYALI